MTDSNLNPFLLAANVPNPDPRLLPLLRSDPLLASRQDAHGYSLLHAAASYNHVELLRSLVMEFKVDVNLVDEDGETCLFVAESIEVARCLVEELHINPAMQNEEGMTAAEKIASEEDFPDVANYLQQHGAGDHRSVNGSSSVASGNVSEHPPPLPPNMNIRFGATAEEGSELEQNPDPEFRRRIEELASKENFNSDEGQRELRELITDAVRGVNHEEREVRRRVD